AWRKRQMSPRWSTLLMIASGCCALLLGHEVRAQEQQVLLNERALFPKRALFSSDGKFVLVHVSGFLAPKPKSPWTCSQVMVWDVSTGKHAFSIELTDLGSVDCVALSPD